MGARWEGWQARRWPEATAMPPESRSAKPDHSLLPATAPEPEPPPTSLLDLPDELFLRIADWVDPNTRATGLRQSCQRARQLLAGCTRVDLAQPVHRTALNSSAFADFWERDGATRALSCRERVQVLCLLASHGCVAYLRCLAVGITGSLEDKGVLGMTLTAAVFNAAAAAGQLPACTLLRELGCPWGEEAVVAAASAGHGELLTWLLDAGCPGSLSAVCAAACSGDPALVEALVHRVSPICPTLSAVKGSSRPPAYHR